MDGIDDMNVEMTYNEWLAEMGLEVYDNTMYEYIFYTEYLPWLQLDEKERGAIL